MVNKSSYIEFILYVADQQRSAAFYKSVLQKEPRLNVPGMTEFQLNEQAVLGLMPERGISKILQGLPSPESGNGIPRCEIYLFVESPEEHYTMAITAGGRGVSKEEERSWGHSVAYVADPDGHIIAFAKKSVK